MVKRLSLVVKSLAHNLTGFRTIVYGSGPMYMADIVNAVEIFGDIFVQIYGQEKCPLAISVPSR
jgi:long-chain acyl-CoA synthetase